MGINKRYSIIALVFLLTVIFGKSALKVFDHSILPYISLVPNNSGITVCCIIIAIGLLYYVRGTYQGRVLRTDRFFIIGYLIMIYTLYKSMYIHHELCGISYFSWVIISCISCECISFIIRLLNKNRSNLKKTKISLRVQPFEVDNASKVDLYGREHYIDVFINKILATFNQRNTIHNVDSFNILLNEEYGYGKTSFLLQLKDRIVKSFPNDIIVVDFSPWHCPNQGMMTNELFRALRKNLQYSVFGLANSITDYWKSLKKIDGIWSWIGTWGETTLEEELSELKKGMEKLSIPVLVIIDDVDRLQPTEILSLLTLLRDTANLPNIYYLIAAHKDFLIEQLKKETINCPDIYLKKFFNYELLLPANDHFLEKYISDSIEATIKTYYNKEKINQHVEEILNLYHFTCSFKSMRDWHRFNNIVTMNLDIMRKEDTLSEIYIPDFYGICLVQFLRPDIYKKLRDQDDLLLEEIESEDPRLMINREINDYFYSISPDSNHKAIRGLKTKEQKTDTQIVPLNYHIEKETFTDEIICLGIISELFSPDINYKHPNKVCYCDSYFKYFSGKNRGTEITNAQCISLLIDYDEKRFRDEIHHIIESDKCKSFVHKINYVINSSHYNPDLRFSISQKLLLFLQLIAEGDKNNSIPVSIYWKNRGYGIWRYIYRMYYSNKDTNISEDEKSAIITYYKTNSQLMSLFVFVNTFSNYAYEKVLIPYELGSELLSILFDRFIKEVLLVKPFSKECLEMMGILNEHYFYYWNKTFINYLKSLKNPEVWIYQIVKQDPDGWVWNNPYLTNISSKSIGNQEDTLKLFGSLLTDAKEKSNYSELIKLRRQDPPNISATGSIFLSNASRWYHNPQLPIIK